MSAPEKPRQQRLFMERFSPDTVAVLLLLPESSARARGIATALGRSMRRDSSFMPLRHGKDVLCVVVEAPQRKAILETLGIDATGWRRYVRQWVGLNIAHKCRRGVVCLWITPLLEQCPNCKAEAKVETSTETPQKRRLRLRKAEAGAPLFVPDTGDANGMKEGDVEPSRSSTSSSLAESNRDQEQDLDPGHGDVEKMRAAALKRLENDPGYQAELAAREAR